MSETGFKAWKSDVVRSIKAQPQKAAVLAALFGILAFACVKWAAEGGPAAASAHAEAAPQAGAAAPARNDAQIELLQKWLDDRIEPIGRRNLFAINLEYFPQDGNKAHSSGSEAREGEFWPSIGKSLNLRADQDKQNDILRRNIVELAREIKLHSTMMSQGKQYALMNGNWVMEGGAVTRTGSDGKPEKTGFTLVKIETTRVIVERQGIKLAVSFENE